MTEGQPPQRKHLCTICNARFSRLSHLQRHQLLHSDEPQEIFKCDLCDKSFNRKDVYLRHHRGVHGLSQTARRNRRKKSCERCIRYKLKCSREIPCTTCKNRDAVCRYNLSSHPESILPPQNDAPEQSTRDASDQIADNAWHNENRPGTRNLRENVDFGAESGIDSLLNAAQLGDTGPATSQIMIEQSRIDNPHAGINHEADAPWPSQEQEEIDDSSILPDFYCAPFDISQEATGLDLIDFGLLFGGSTFQASRTDWLGAAADYSDRQTLDSIHLPSESPYDLDNRPAIEEASAASIATPVPQVDGTSVRAEGVSNQQTRSDWPHSLDKGGNESWPFDYTSNKGYRKIKLPPLRQVLEQTVGHRPVIDRTTLLDLIRIFGSPFIPVCPPISHSNAILTTQVLNDSPAPEALPAVNFLTKLVKVYYEEFHPVINVIHLPTWKIEECPTALLASMACLGATYSSADGSSDVAVLLAEITQRALFWAGQEDTTSWRDPAYITAMCLHHTYSLGSGNRRLYELADAARGVMVTSLRGIGVLADNSESSDSITDSAQLRQLNDAELEDAWSKWRSRELKKRVAWMVFEFDCTISTMTNKRGAFNISELPARLPCSNSLWEAHSSKAWLAMMSFSAGPISGSLFYALMQDLTASKANLASIPVWGRRLCSLAISRILWDLKEMKAASAPNMFGITSLAAGYKTSSESMLQSLDALNESLSSPTSTAEVVNLNVTCLSTYYTDLITRTSAMDLIIFIFRNSGRQQSSQLSAELSGAKEHLRSTFGRNPIDTRRSVVSAANIVNVARECTSFTPCEVMRLFNGYAYLLAFVRFFPFDLLPNAAISARLDILPWRRSESEQNDLHAWVERGGRAKLSPVDDICDTANFNQLKQQGLLALSELRMWGLARKFHRVLQGLA
jgi:hypothetical protein